LLLEGAGISREHFRLHSESDRIFVTDLSSNGTWVNARRLSPGESHPVTSLDAIQIPGFEIRIEVPEPVKAPEQVKVDETPAPPPEPLAPEAAEPQQGALAAGSVRTFLDSFSTLEKLLIVLALLTLTLVVIYLAA
jgi:pSer/pThr/pTyr-binding forkhead associated (FHA) protein